MTDEQFANAAERWPKDTPTTKEAYWYREQFESWFPQEACIDSVERWIPRRDWGEFFFWNTMVFIERIYTYFSLLHEGCPEDPSGRAQRVHNSAYDNVANV